MNKLYNILYNAVGKIYVPNEILENSDNTLIHISDTPTICYSSLKYIIKKIKPNYIVHTGDLVDNIKLEIRPDKIHDYSKNVKKLFEILENTYVKEIYISLGNHDNSKVVNKIATKSIIIDKTSTININNINIKISHFPNEIKDFPSQLNLFGHDLSIPSKIKNSNIFLNGISDINIVNMNNLNIYKLPYPIGTDDSRLCKRKIGI